MPSTARAAENTAFDQVRTTPFTRIHGCPSRSDYETLKQEAAAIASKVEDITYDWSRDAATGNEYGLLAEILGPAEYDHQTNISTYTSKRPSRTHTTQQSTTPRPPTRANARKRSGTAYALAGTSARVS